MNQIQSYEIFKIQRWLTPEYVSSTSHHLFSAKPEKLILLYRK